MKKLRLLFSMVCALMVSGMAYATPAINLTPVPMYMTVNTGSYTLPHGLRVSTAGLSDEMTAEVNNFVAAINKATDLEAVAVTGTGNITVKVDPEYPAEGYALDVTTKNVSITASTPAGLFYAFQTIKKILPPNVMAGVAPEAPIEAYELPCVTIYDEPRFPYRGFMLDVSRHFFDVNQVKKMLDLMAMFKLNRFHWHLTDDQGWRLPVEKYPLLTTVGATNHGILRTDFSQGKQWREPNDQEYGPYAYTADEIKDVVAYAKNLHIEVIPEIDMPGHMVAAIHAYPEFSTDPESKLASENSDFTHEIWNKGGISKDVLDVSNPKVIQFVKDVVDVLAELFPYEYIHIGGDECPTFAWSRSESCQAMKKDLRITSDAGLQSWFTKQIADYAAETHGRKIMGWNEIITSGGANVTQVRKLQPAIFCWYPADNAATLCESYKLDHIYTPFNGGYYINRSYRGFDPVGAVGDGALSTAYNVLPPDHKYCIGVQGTFWTEQVDRPTDVEYLALPRLQAIAEQGWSPADKKDYDDFMARACADTVLLNLAGYNYGRHQLVSVDNYRKPDPQKWYRLQSTCSDERSGRCWELLSETSPLISTYTDKGAQANRLWTNTPAEDNDWQLFRFIEDPDHAGHYAIVCKALPDGSLNPVPSATSLAGRWDYLPDEVNYGFEFDRNYYSTTTPDIRYAIRPIGASNQYLNCSKGGQGMAINVYNAPADGSGGIMSFVEADAVTDPNPPTPPVTGDVPVPGAFYRLLTRFNGDSSQPRYGSCIELLRDDAGKGNNAQADRLWSNKPVADTEANYDYQWFTFEADPDGSGYYAMVSKAKPDGSVNSVPSVSTSSNTARWDYDNTTKHYGFYLVEEVKGKSTQGTDDAGFYSALTSKDATSGWYMNTSAAGQGFSVHLYSDPTDQNAGIYTFEPAPTGVTTIAADIVSGNEAIYDLQGRRLRSISTPGIYIVDGRKIYVR